MVSCHYVLFSGPVFLQDFEVLSYIDVIYGRGFKKFISIFLQSFVKFFRTSLKDFSDVIDLNDQNSNVYLVPRYGVKNLKRIALIRLTINYLTITNCLSNKEVEWILVSLTNIGMNNVMLQLLYILTSFRVLGNPNDGRNMFFYVFCA